MTDANTVNQLINDVAIGHKIVHGPATGSASRVPTEGGPVRTFARIQNDFMEGVGSALLLQGGVYTTEEEGRVAVKDNENFMVEGAGEVAVYGYRRINATTSKLIATYPSTAAVRSLNPVFVPFERDGQISETPIEFIGFVKGLWIEGARPGKDYKLNYFQNQNAEISPVGDGFILFEFDAGTWDNERYVVSRLAPLSQPINRDLELQAITINSDAASSPDMKLHLLLNPRNLPPLGTQIRSSYPVDKGYSWKVSTLCYDTYDRRYVDGISSLSKNRTVAYPMESRMHAGIPVVHNPSSELTKWIFPVLECRVGNADPLYFYRIAGIYPPVHPSYPCRWIIERQLRSSYLGELPSPSNTQRLVTYTDDAPVYEANAGERDIVVTNPRIKEKFYITLDTNLLPNAGSYNATTRDTEGFTYLIHPSMYTYMEPDPKAYIDEISSLTKNRTVTYPFESRLHSGVPPLTTPSAALTKWLYPILEFRVQNADPLYFYRLIGIYPPAYPELPCRWIIERQLRSTFDTAGSTERLITYNDEQPLYPINAGVQSVMVSHSRSKEKFYISIDTNLLPNSGRYDGTTSDTEGYTYIAHPSMYTYMEAAAQPVLPKISTPIQLSKVGSRALLSWNRNVGFDMSLQIQPNGFNDLFNIRTIKAKRLADNVERALTDVLSDCYPPMVIMSQEQEVDVWEPSDDRPVLGYTGGNHGAGAGSRGGAAGSKSAQMQYLRHFADGVELAADSNVQMGITEYRTEHLNMLRAWNTIDVDRFVVEQKFITITRRNVHHLWCEVTALENINVHTDNGFQTFTNGWETLLYLNGENRTSRVNIADAAGLTPGPASTTGKACFAMCLQGDDIAGNQVTWIDRAYGQGDGRTIGGSAGYFRRGTNNNTKLYSAMVANKILTMAPGDKYVWHMALIWGGLEDDPNIDSSVVFEDGGDLRVIYAKLDSMPGQINNNLELGKYVNGQLVDMNGITVTDAAGAYELPVVNKTLNQLISDIKAMKL